MRQIGKLITCDRCGEKVFMEREERKKSGLDLDSMVIETFTDEDKVMNEWNFFKDLNCDLCPACSVAYRGIMKDFMDQAKWM